LERGINAEGPRVPTEKELLAFVERVAKRASPRGSHRAVFVAVHPLVEHALAAGHTMKATWDALRAEGKVTMTYETFRAHCRQAGLGRAAVRPSGDRERAERPSTMASEPQLALAQERPDEQPRGFQHSRLPRKERIYG
jgi:hypothetical protein